MAFIRLLPIVSLLLLCLSASAHLDEWTCSPGTRLVFRDGAVSCETCPTGTYADTRNATECTKCPPGTYNAFRGGLTDYGHCIPCPPDTFSPVAGGGSLAACKPCPKGSYSQGAATRCFKCKRGHGLMYSDTECEKCKSGMFNPGGSGHRKFCMDCPSGTYANVYYGAWKCLPCPKGSYRDIRYSLSNSRYKCDLCPRNTYANRERTHQCALCPLGMVSERGSTSCKSCPKGTFRGRIKMRECSPCPAGTTTVNVDGGSGAAAACKHPVRGCPFDTFEDRAGACRACLPGERLDVATKECVKCGAGEVSRGGAATTCTKCGRGTAPAPDVSVFEGSECMCKLGWARSVDGACRPCRPGTKGSAAPDKNGDFDMRYALHRYFYRKEPFCEPCQSGEVSERPGSLECKVCPRHSIAFREGSSKCWPCPEGSRQDVIAEPFYMLGYLSNVPRQCFNLRDTCNVGMTFSIERWRCLWDSCIPPRKRNLYGGCSACNSQQYYTRYNDRAGGCASCKEGFSNEVDRPHTNNKCFKCPENAAVRRGQCTCNKGFVPKAGKCKPCGAGTVYKNGACVTCRKGVTWRDGGTSRTKCTLQCRGNKYLPKGAKKCVPCPAGTKKMYGVVGNPLNMCAPVDPYRRRN